ncbi:MAG: hypothetical protein A2X67_10450 [Ignavibacteria bacterium GWA2_55_11]|nr:MAG: hypothetical protein A2X67_10450 [Ignavibacteria bacterium GWA2_55_11]OGU47884.1 MAG: hypothetical protein A2X68_07180 [Ignavibacteria bacterium GWC2_56_12]OGU65100.1 MAG: hypothetical protein A3C56_11495 [Ignavibacteria bacterium RIFCSPHIGHO2_02_FULL_56_12]HAV24462.1 hypothetical protein [Bacteroidota bacterium]
MTRITQFLKNYEYAIIAWVIIIWLVTMAIYYSWDREVIGAFIILVGVIGQAFAALGVWVGLVPVVGPLVVKVLTLPLIWLLNGIGTIVSYIAIKRGYTKDLVNTRVLAVVLLIGITVGFILGKLI